jgi:hypothetical protein
MSKVNLYWPVYQNLEKEMLVLTNEIHFCDEQLGVYSLKIADLLIRACVEIESISKELYEHAGGNMSPTDINGKDRDLFFDTDCINFLNDNWNISEKQVLVSSPTIYFESNDNLTLTPLNKAFKRGTSGSNWKRAYQMVKHARVQAFNTTKDKNIVRPNIRNLVHAMAALYLLNIYYMDEQYSAKNTSTLNAEFDSSLGSLLFSINFTSLSISNQANNVPSTGRDANLVGNTYLVLHSDSTVDSIRGESSTAFNRQRDDLLKSSEYIQFVTAGGTFDDCHNLNAVGMKVFSWAFAQQIKQLPTKDEQIKTILSSVEFKEYRKNNPKLAETVSDDVEKLCNTIGSWRYIRKIGSYTNTFFSLITNSNLNIVLNKGQNIYTGRNTINA